MTALFPGDRIVEHVRVAVERAIDAHPDGLTYGVPADLAGVRPGERVRVGLGRGNAPAEGWVVDVETAPEIDADRVKPILAREPSVDPLPGELLALARWIAEYYVCPLGVVLAAMVPSAVKRGTGLRTLLFVDLAAPSADPGADPGPVRSPAQRRVLEAVTAIPAEDRPAPIERVMEAAGIRTRGPVQRLVESGHLRLERRSSVSARWRSVRVDDRVPDRLSADQARALEAIGPSLGAGFSQHLIHGVTGSGKTEVYLRLVEQVVASGRTALLLVPEIALTPQATARMLGRFPDERIAILHSGLTASQRHQQWNSAARGTASIVLGARSAVFAPIPDETLGLVVVDEEHDGSFKQDRAPRYHGRDVAIRRAQLAGCPIVLGSATPSMETWAGAVRHGRVRLHSMPERVPGMRLPTVRVVDLAGERRRRAQASGGRRDTGLIGPTLEDALKRTLDTGGQAILLLNRRGYAGWIGCPSAACGWVMTCTECDVSMVEHRDRTLPAGGFVRCHHCGSEQRVPTGCPDCGKRPARLGLGTQRVEEELAARIPALVAGETLVRVDSDTVRQATEMHGILERFGDGAIRVLTGTQMLAKGLDYPNVRLVGVVNADTAINLPDFRAAERTYQLVSQVAGRCGRSTDPARAGLVVVQTYNPDAPAIRYAAAHDFEAFAASELDDREGAMLPPFARMVRIVVRDPDPAAAENAARRLATDLGTIADPGVMLGEAAPCPITRVAGRFRWDVEMRASAAVPLQRTLARARNEGIVVPGAAVAVDVDPAAML